MENDLDKRYQTLIVLWFAMFMNIGIFFAVSVFFAPGVNSGPTSPSSALLIVALTALGTFLVIASFAVRSKFNTRAVDNQDVSLVQKGLVIACAMCEAGAMLGLLERYIIGNREYYLLFLLAAGGTVFHFPRRSQLEAASFKKSIE